MTPPASRHSGLRYWAAFSWAMPDGSSAESFGTCAMLNAPVASTTALQCQAPCCVTTWYPSPMLRTEVTGQCVRTETDTSDA